MRATSIGSASAMGRASLRGSAWGEGRVSLFERLEDRAMMAGDVSACCVKGSLILKGDNCDNQVCIRQIGDCKWEITGKCGTTINGCESWIVKGVKCDVSINLKGGCDTIKICDGVIKGCLSVCDTKGTTELCFSNLCVGGLGVKTNGSADSCYLSCVDVTCSSSKAGKSASNGAKYGSCCIDTGAGCDNVLLYDCCVRCCIDIKCGSGDDMIALVQCTSKTICCDSGYGCDEVCVTECRAECTEIKCDRQDELDCKDNYFKTVKCAIPSKDDCEPVIRELCDKAFEICESKDWRDFLCEEELPAPSLAA